MASESPEVIEQQMEETRQSLTEKVSALETQVVGTMQSATQAVQDTVDTVKTAVQDTMDSVKEGVQETLDVKQHVQRNPLMMVGGAVVVGLVTGLVLFRHSARLTTATAAPIGYPPDVAPTPPARAAVAAAALAPDRSGFVGDILNLAEGEAKQLAREAVNQTVEAVRQHVLPSLISWVTQGIERSMQRHAVPADPYERRERSAAARV